MRIGTMFLGEVDKAMGESIQTKFLVIGVPIVPLSSHYVIHDRGTSISGFEIPLNGKSVVLGYLRVGLWLAAFLAGVWYFIDTRRHGDLLPWVLLLGVGSFVSTFVLGRLSKAEKLRRGMLKELAGIAAPPALVPAAIRDDIAARVLAVWDKAHDGRAWDRAIEDGVDDIQLFVIAEYHLRPDLAARALDTFLTKQQADGTETPYRD